MAKRIATEKEKDAEKREAESSAMVQPMIQQMPMQVHVQVPQEALNKAMKAGKTSADVHVDMLTSLKSNLRASQNRQRNSDYFRECSCYRNGIEAKVSDLRRNYQVDNLPPIGRGARKLLFGLSVMASNTKSQIRCQQRKVIEKLFPARGGNYTLQTV